MAGNVRLVLKSVFDDKGIKNAKAEFAKVGSEIGKAMAAVGAVVAVAGAATLKFGIDAVKAAEGVATANARLGQIADSMGIFGDQAGQVTDRLIKFAEANELTVAVDAEVIKATQAKLLTFKNLAATADETGGAMDRATMAAIDLAAAGFGSAETNAVQLGKALQDPIKGITALGRAGVTFTEQEREKIKVLVESGKMLDAQNVILEALETQVGGTAAATANSSEKMRLAFDNIKESVGMALLPAFDDLTNVVISDLTPVLTDLASDLGPLLVDTMEVIAQVLKEATDESTPLGKSIKGVQDAFSLLITVLGSGEGQVKASTNTMGMFADILEFIITTLASFIAFIKSVGMGIDALLRGDVAKFWEWLTSDPIEFIENQSNAQNALKQTREQFLNTADSARKLNNISLDKLRGQLGDTRQAARDFAGMQRQLYNAMMGIKDPVTTTTTTTTTTGGKTPAEIRAEQVEAAEKAFERVQKLVRATQKRITDAQSSYDKAVAKANKDYTEQIVKLREDYAKRLEQIVISSQNRLRDAFRTAIGTSLSELFGKEGERSVTTLVENLRQRVVASRQLIENSSQLASLGFTQTFIEQVVSAGVETGNELASAILKSTPETQAELRKLFGALETTSERGMDQLAKRIFEEQGLATKELRDLYKNTNIELENALVEQQVNFQRALEAAAVELRDKLKDIKADFEEDVADLKGSYGGLKGVIDGVSRSLDSMIGKADQAAKAASEAAIKAANATRAAIGDITGTKPSETDLGLGAGASEGLRGFGDPLEMRRLAAIQAAGSALGQFGQGFINMVTGQRSFSKDGQVVAVSGNNERRAAELIAQGFVETFAANINRESLNLALALAEEVYGVDIGGISTPGQVGGNTFNITVNAGMGTDPITVGREIVDAIKRFERSSGQVFVGV